MNVSYFSILLVLQSNIILHSAQGYYCINYVCFDNKRYMERKTAKLPQKHLFVFETGVVDHTLGDKTSVNMFHALYLIFLYNY